MSTETITEDENALRSLARKQVLRVRNFRFHLAAFVVGTVILTGVWVLTEYLEADGWPERFGDEDAPGTWHLWILYVVGVWALIVALKALGTYFGRRPSEAEVERELERLRSQNRVDEPAVR